MSAHTHESDKALWLKAHHMAPAFTLAPGVMLSEEQRDYALERIAENEEADHRERMESKAFR